MSCQECYINNQGAQGQQALGLGDYKPDIAFHDFKVMFILPQTTQCSYQTMVHVSHLWHSQKL